MSDTSSKPLTADDYAKARRHLDGSHDAAWLESFTRLILVNAEEQAREVERLRAALTHIIERYEQT